MIRYERQNLPKECIDWMNAVEQEGGFRNLIEFAPTIYFAYDNVQSGLVKPLTANLILWGAGGFGKSEAGYHLMRTLPGLDGDYEKHAFNARTTPNGVFGDENILEWETTGQKVINSVWASKKVVLIEEILDAPIPTLESLKAALTYREAMLNSVRLKLETILMIGAANKDPKALETNMSIEALMSRFAWKQRVGWLNLDQQGWQKCAKEIIEDGGRKPFTSSTLQYLLNIAWATKLSPRDLINITSASIGFARGMGKKVADEQHLGFALMMNGKAISFQQEILAAQQKTAADMLKSTMDTVVGKLKDEVNPLIREATDNNKSAKPKRLAELYKEIAAKKKEMQPQLDVLMSAQYQEEKFGAAGKKIALDIASQAGEIADQLDKGMTTISRRLADATVELIEAGLQAEIA